MVDRPSSLDESEVATAERPASRKLLATEHPHDDGNDGLVPERYVWQHLLAVHPPPVGSSTASPIAATADRNGSNAESTRAWMTLAFAAICYRLVLAHFDGRRPRERSVPLDTRATRDSKLIVWRPTS